MNRILTTLFAFFVCLISHGQDSMLLNLEQAILQAQDYSQVSQLAKQRYLGSYYRNRSFWKGFYPEMSLSGTLPNINRSLQSVVQPDGTEEFVQRSLNTTDLRLSLSQAIAPTGGRVFLSSGIQRIDLYGDNPSSSYLTTPLAISLSQPIFGYNSMRWDIKLREVQQDQFEKTYQEDLEEVARVTANLFFRLLEADIMERTAKRNKSYNDTLYSISEGRYEMGKIAENELLQIELALLNSQLALQRASLTRKLAELRLKNHIGHMGNERFTPFFAEEIPAVSIDMQKAMEYAFQNNSSQIQWRYNKLNAERNVAQAKAEKTPEMDLFASYGRSQSADNIPSAYQNTESQEMVSLGFSIPIYDWGSNKSNYLAALADQKANDANYNIAMLEFQEAIITSVQEFEMKYSELEIAKRAEEIATRRYRVSQQRFSIGKIGMTDMNIAMAEKDTARRNYISSLQAF